MESLKSVRSSKGASFINQGSGYNPWVTLSLAVLERWMKDGQPKDFRTYELFKDFLQAYESLKEGRGR